MEWVWVPLPLNGAPTTGQPTHKAELRRIGSGYRPLYGDAPQQEPLTYGQQATGQAYLARMWRVFGNDARADACRVRCAELVEFARENGEHTQTAGELIAQAENDGEAARRRNIERQLQGFTDGGGYRYNLRDLVERQGTDKEKNRDWARIILAKAERGGNVTSAARSIAERAVHGYDEPLPEGWQHPLHALKSAPYIAQPNTPTAYDATEELPW